MTAPSGLTVAAMTVGLRPKVLIGRSVAAMSVLLVALGLVTLLVIGRAEYIVDDFVPHLALLALAFAGLTWLAVPRQPDNAVVWAAACTAAIPAFGLAAWATSIALASLAGLDASRAASYSLSPAEVPGTVAVGAMLSDVSWVGLFIPATLGLLLFPDGAPPSPRWRWVGWASVVTMVALTILLLAQELPDSSVRYGTDVTELTGLGRLVAPLMLLLTALSGCCVASVVVGHRRSRGTLRQQYRWLGVGTAALLGAIASVEVANFAWGIDPFGWGRIVMLLGIATAVACYGIGVTRYRLYDVDVIISRTASYGILAAFIGAAYVALVVVTGDLLDLGTHNPVLAVATMTIAALAFDPLRQRVQRWADRQVYGRRPDPYAILSDLTPRLARSATGHEDALLDRLAQLMALGTGAAEASVWSAHEGTLVALAGWPRPPTPAVAASLDVLPGLSLPVRHEGVLLGALQVTASPLDPLTNAGRRTLADLAGLAALILRDLRLDAALADRVRQLRASRRRLVHVQDVEQGRLEGELRAGVEQKVLALARRIDEIERESGVDVAGPIGDLLRDAAAATRAAADEIDALARGIRPPALARGGLGVALSARATELPVPLQVRVDRVDDLPEPVASALYFVAMEAIANAIKHARPSRLQVDVRPSPAAVLMEVTDDGIGLDSRQSGRTRGGLLNIRDRVEALGGTVQLRSDRGHGTTVAVRIPLDPSPGR